MCNFKREKLLFVLDQHLDFTAITAIQIPDESQYSKESYYNNIRFFIGSDFYFDYTLADYCFIYYDIWFMKCLKAKDGYAVYNFVAIPSSQCSYHVNSAGTLIMYN